MADPKEAIKERSMVIQKDMLAKQFQDLSKAKELGKKVCYTFVPGNLIELVLSFDMLPVYPEINALQSGMRKKSGGFIKDAEKIGYSEDVCTYVKCDIGMMLNGNIGPTGEKLPDPDLLLLSYTGCFTFLKWFENLNRLYPNAEIAMLHTPYQEDGKITQEQIEYMVKQLKEDVIPKMEKVTGKKFDEKRLSKMLSNSVEAENYWVKILELAKQKPSPIDSYFAGVYYMGPINTAFRGTAECLEYYKELGINDRVRFYQIVKLYCDSPYGTLLPTKFYRIEDKVNRIYAFKPRDERFFNFTTEGAKVIITNAYHKHSQQMTKIDLESLKTSVRYKQDYLRRIKEATYYEI